MEENKKIYKAINSIMSEIGHIAKERKNQQQGFFFRGVDQVLNTLSPLLAKHGVTIIPEVVDQKREERLTKSGTGMVTSLLTIRFHFVAVDGSEVVAVVVGEGMDTADKATNKALSVGFKYACFQVFCIPTEEVDDPDASTPEVSQPAIFAAVQRTNTLAELAALWSGTTPEQQANNDIVQAFSQQKRRLTTKK